MKGVLWSHRTSFLLFRSQENMMEIILFDGGRAFWPVSREYIFMLQNHHLLENYTVLITTNSKNRIPVFQNSTCALEAIETLYRVQELHPFFLYAFVIMPDHCHFLMKVTEGETLSRVMRVFKGGVSHNIGRGPIWQSKFDAKPLNNSETGIWYIHQNPVKAGLVEHAEDYPWSSASGKWDVSLLEMQW